MKFLLPLAAGLALGTINAAALPLAENINNNKVNGDGMVEVAKEKRTNGGYVPDLADRTADAEADAEAMRWCHRIGEPCWKKKREADAAAAAATDVETPKLPTTAAVTTAEKDIVKKDPEAIRWCHQIGEPCWKAKRAAEALTEALAQPESEASPEAERWCHRIGEPCWKAKRDLEMLKVVSDEWNSLEL